jgi:hypothetical protein
MEGRPDGVKPRIETTRPEFRSFESLHHQAKRVRVGGLPAKLPMVDQGARAARRWLAARRPMREPTRVAPFRYRFAHRSGISPFEFRPAWSRISV